MLIGVPREIKQGERRVGLTPHAVRELVLHGHSVIVESGAGEGIGASDAEFESAAAEITARPEDVRCRADMVVKVKEPQSAERRLPGEGQILFAYLHLAPDHDQTTDLVESGAACIAYETVTSTRAAVEAEVLAADLVIGAVLVTGARAPKLVTATMIGKMRPGPGRRCERGSGGRWCRAISRR